MNERQVVPRGFLVPVRQKGTRLDLRSRLPGTAPRTERGLQPQSLRRCFLPSWAPERTVANNGQTNSLEFRCRQRRIHSSQPIARSWDWPSS